jgi:hypothetical protein
MENVEQNLKDALEHLNEALDISIASILRDEKTKTEIGKNWEVFLGDFFNLLRVKGKESRLNLLSFVKFPRL